MTRPQRDRQGWVRQPDDLSAYGTLAWKKIECDFLIHQPCAIRHVSSKANEWYSGGDLMLRRPLLARNTTKRDARWRSSLWGRVQRTHQLPQSAQSDVRVGTSVGSEKPVPKGVDHSEIAVRVQMVDEVKLLLALEPSETS
jgi:hypothetical protein